jgi:lysophospholipase L1-like esterase
VKDNAWQKLRKWVTYKVYSAKFRREPTGPGDIVFLGDSITKQGDWASWFAGQPVQVRGIGGDRAPGVLARLDSVLDRPSKVFLMIGSSDVWLDGSTESVVDAVRQIVVTVRERTPSTELYVQSITPRTAAMAPAIRAVNAGLRELTCACGSTYVDLFDLLADEDGGLRPGFSDDELHLLAPAYDVWREAIRPYVEA